MDHAAGYWLQQGLNGLSIAGFYVTLACAYALLQGITNRVIVSFGDMAMFAAFAAVYCAFAMLLSGFGDLAVLLAALAAAVASGVAIGHVAAKQVFAPLVSNSSQALLISSLGVSIILQEIMRLQSGARDQWLPPQLLPHDVMLADGSFPVRLGALQVLTFTVAALAVIGIALLLHFTRMGRFWRAVREDQQLCSLCGVDTRRVLLATSTLAAGLAAIAGWNVTVAYGGVSFHMGLVLGFKAMFASVIGGFGRISGAVAGGVVLAAVETGWSAFFPLAYRDVAVFALVIAILYLKPEGLLGRPVHGVV
jgi:branched-chain amino acid transport system permease protein